MDKKTMHNARGSQNKLWTIIRNFSAYRGYPFEAINADALAMIEEASARLTPADQRHRRILVRMLECFLQISGQQVSAETFDCTEIDSIYEAFVGAIWSEQIIDRPVEWKRPLTKALNALILALANGAGKCSTFPFVALGSHAATPEIRHCVDIFSRIPLNEEKVWLWRGWITETRSGREIGLPLFPLYKRMGREFTDRFFSVCDVYSRARRGYQLSGLKELAVFIGQHSGSCTSEDLKDPLFITTFWREFLAFYMVTRFDDGNGPLVSSLVSEWRKRIVNFVTEALEPSGLFAKPIGAFPSPGPDYVTGSKTNIKTTACGTEVKVKLITNIPLQVTDDEAMQLLFFQIQSDHDVFVDWAKRETEDIWDRYQHRIAIAAEGTVRDLHQYGMAYGNRRWLTDRHNPRHLHNAAATFAHNGFHQASHAQDLYPRPLSQTAQELALPVTDALYPHCVLLVAEHPEITPSFLENFELFDRNGHMSGFVRTDGGGMLVGCKFRKGARLGEQRIPLTKTTEAIVEQIIALTQSARDFLQEENNDAWRFLLITCRRGFGYPSRVTSLFQKTAVKSRIVEFAESLGTTCKLPYDARVDLVKRFSLVSLRSSAAVLVYLRTGSVEEMSKALGHATYSHRLLSSYLPEPIAAFFQDRWIRIFQTGIIVEALKDSDFLLEASGFENLDQLSEFLANHALKIPPTTPDDANLEVDREPSESRSRVVFGVNTQILTVLLSLQAAVERSVRQVSGKARYWAGIADRLVAFIESELNNRPDLRRYLEQARLDTDPARIESILYG